jgi:predicted RNA polymerase sigma factor
MPGADVHKTIEAVWRIESAKIIGGLARVVRDVGVAEELAQDALVAALETWPASGVPDNPGAWLMTTAKRRGLDSRRGLFLQRFESPGDLLMFALLHLSSAQPVEASPLRGGHEPCPGVVGDA